MATVVNSLPRWTYNWDLWFDGQIWKLEQGIDFPTPVNTFRHLVKYHARKRGLSAVIVAPAGMTVWIQAHRGD